MSIANKTMEIAQLREKELPKILAVRKRLEELLERSKKFEGLKKMLVDPDGNPLVNGHYGALLKQYPEYGIGFYSITTEQLQANIHTAIAECDALINRYSRKKVNISVVGQARIGKSRLLLSITGLDERVIPSYDGTDCTGAVSMITNDASMRAKEVRAELTFRTEEEIVDEVNTYLKALIATAPEDFRKNGIRLVTTLADIGQIKMDKVLDSIPSGDTNSDLYSYLEKYVVGYPDWMPLIKKGSDTLTDPDKIQEYVAQNNGKDKAEFGYRPFYKYLVVKVCNIFCHFIHEDAGSITMLDTIGLGDRALGIEDKMLETVKDRSDAVILLIKPYDKAGGGISKKDKEVYKLINDVCKNRSLDSWLFWMLNEDHRPSKNNVAECQVAMDTLTSTTNKWFGKIKKCVDVSDSSEVDAYLGELLESLMLNLADVDKVYRTAVSTALDRVRAEYDFVCAGVNKLLNTTLVSPQVQPLINRKKRETIDNNMRLLNAKVAEYQFVRHQECEAVQSASAEFLEKLCSDDFLPTQDDIIKALQVKPQPSTVYTDYCNELRNRIIHLFAGLSFTVDQLIVDVKNDIATMMIEGAQLGKVLAPPDENVYEWLDIFRREILCDQTLFHNLNEAFSKLYSFDLSINGFLTYEVRDCLDPIDPSLVNPPQLVNEDGTNTIYEVAANIWTALFNNVSFVRDMLFVKLQEINMRPNKAIFAEVDYFRDTLEYAKGVEYEWDNLYTLHSSNIWGDIIRENAKSNAMTEDIVETLEKLTAYSRSASSFEYK